jgi:hypothetical protein
MRTGHWTCISDPEAPAGKEKHWIQSVPGKGWNTMLRLYGPLEPWFDKTWRPGEIEHERKNAWIHSGPGGIRLMLLASGCASN